jgi:probable metal-binding protein
MNTTITIIPANKVMGIVKDFFSDISFDKHKLKEKLEEEFQIKSIENISFENCHQDTFNFDDLLDFFVQRGKLTKNNDLFELNRNFKCGCSHHDTEVEKE